MSEFGEVVATYEVIHYANGVVIGNRIPVQPEQLYIIDCYDGSLWMQSTPDCDPDLEHVICGPLPTRLASLIYDRLCDQPELELLGIDQVINVAAFDLWADDAALQRQTVMDTAKDAYAHWAEAIR